MDKSQDRENLIKRIRELMTLQNQKIDAASDTPEIKSRSEGYLEALYHVENVLINS